jgi:uncharacterized damage-inducible protein DinB
VTLQDYLAFHIWATGRLIAAVAQLSESEMHQQVGGPFGTVFATLVHLYSAEDIWLSRWQGQAGVGFTPPDQFASFAELSETYTARQQELCSFVETQDLATSVQVKGQYHTLAEMLWHVLDHASYHRGQIMAYLRALGHTPPQTNLIHYLREPKS